MKKTLIALAVLAASGASFAQVTITGSLAMGYTAKTTAGVDTSGLGVDTSEVYFNATEDLGGGMKIAAKMGLAGADRSGESGNGSVNGRDASLALTTGAGMFVLSANRAADYLSGGVSGVAGIGMDGKTFGARRIADAIAYVVPVGPAVLTLQHQENDLAKGAIGLGVNATGSNLQRLNVIGLGYAAGKLAVNGQYLSYDNRSNAAGGAANATASYVTRAAASYDLGVAKLGLGVSQANYTGGGTAQEWLVGASVPMGALTFGAQYSSRKQSDMVIAADGTTFGSGLKVSYDLSKRTSIVSTYTRWDVLNQSTANTEWATLLVHNF